MTFVKATLQNLDTNDAFPCLFNPTEYTMAKTNSWEPKKAVGKNVPDLTFTGGQNSTLQMQLFFDVFEQKGDVRLFVNKLWKLVLIDEKKKNSSTHRGRPPRCRFQWGGNWSFDAVVTSLSVRYTLFSEDGTPVRATADVSFQEAKDVTIQPGTNPTSFVEEPGRKRRVVQPHDTLAWIAYDEYGDAGKWRLIAQDNKIDDPLDLRPGQILAIPPVG